MRTSEELFEEIKRLVAKRAAEDHLSDEVGMRQTTLYEAIRDAAGLGDATRWEIEIIPSPDEGFELPQFRAYFSPRGYIPLGPYQGSDIGHPQMRGHFGRAELWLRPCFGPGNEVVVVAHVNAGYYALLPDSKAPKFPLIPPENATLSEKGAILVAAKALQDAICDIRWVALPEELEESDNESN